MFEQKVKTVIGQLMFENIALASELEKKTAELEQAQARIAELEGIANSKQKNGRGKDAEQHHTSDS